MNREKRTAIRQEFAGFSPRQKTKFLELLQREITKHFENAKDSETPVGSARLRELTEAFSLADKLYTEHLKQQELVVKLAAAILPNQESQKLTVNIIYPAGVPPPEAAEVSDDGKGTGDDGEA